MNVQKTFKSLCKPAALYFVLSLLALLFVVFQNMNNTHTLCVGNFSCSVPSTTLVFLLNLLYIMFWTWILQLICKAGWKWVSWALVLFPFIAVFIIILLTMNQM